MNEQHDAQTTELRITPSITVDAEVVHGEPAWVTLYQPDGTAMQVQSEDAPKMQARYGLLTARYDMESATADFWAAYHAAEDAIQRSLTEIRGFGYARNETVSVLNAAMGSVESNWKILALTIGAQFPMEDLVASVAVHKQVHGSLDNLPLLADLETLADEMNERDPGFVTNTMRRSQAEPTPAA